VKVESRKNAFPADLPSFSPEGERRSGTVNPNASTSIINSLCNKLITLRVCRSTISLLTEGKARSDISPLIGSSNLKKSSIGKRIGLYLKLAFLRLIEALEIVRLQALIKETGRIHAFGRL
jgi:hypothetical protein